MNPLHNTRAIPAESAVDSTPQGALAGHAVRAAILQIFCLFGLGVGGIATMDGYDKVRGV